MRRCALQLMRMDASEFLRRIAIICLEVRSHAGCATACCRPVLPCLCVCNLLDESKILMAVKLCGSA